MTRLPHESRLVIDRPDLPEYELNRACPITGEVTGLENHHLWPRSFGTKSWWVELHDGEVVGNRIKLSNKAHYRVTVNKARIVYEGTVFYWEEDGERTPLRWQPPTLHKRKPQDAVERLAERVDGLIEEAEFEAVFNQLVPLSPELRENLEEQGISFPDWVPDLPNRDEVHPGEECRLCHRRVPHPKKASSPKTKVFSTRVPIDDVDTFSELVDAAAAHHGLKSKPHFAYWTLLYGVTLLLQAERGELPQ